MNAALKRALWCRWSHRYRMPKPQPAPVTSSIPGQPGALRLTAGPSRSLCDACEHHDYASQAARRWLTS